MLTQIEFTENGLSYLLNEEDETAELLRSSSINNDIIYSDFVFYESKKYSFVSIFEGA